MKKITPFKVKDYSIIKSRDDFYKGIMRQYGFEYYYDGFPLTATHIGSQQLLGEPGVTNNTVVNNTYVTNTNHFYNDYRSLNLSLTEVQKTLKSFGAEFGALSELSRQMTTATSALKLVKSTAPGRENAESPEGAAFEGFKKKILTGGIAHKALSKSVMLISRVSYFGAAKGFPVITEGRAARGRITAGAKAENPAEAGETPVYKYESKYPEASEGALPGYIKYKSSSIFNNFFEGRFINKFPGGGIRVLALRGGALPGDTVYTAQGQNAVGGEDSFFIPVSVRYGISAAGASKQAEPGILKAAADFGRTLFAEQIRNIERNTKRYIQKMGTPVMAVQLRESAAAVRETPDRTVFEKAAVSEKQAAATSAKRPGKGKTSKPGMKASEINKIMSEIYGMDIKMIPSREKTIIREVLDGEFANSVLTLEKERLNEIFKEVFDIKTVSDKEAAKKILRERISREISKSAELKEISESVPAARGYVSVRETRYLETAASGAYEPMGREAGYGEALRTLSRELTKYFSVIGPGAASGPYRGIPDRAEAFGTDFPESAEEFVFSILPAEIRYKTQREFQLLTPAQQKAAVKTLYRSFMKILPDAGAPLKVKETAGAPLQMKAAGVRTETERAAETAAGGAKNEKRTITGTKPDEVILNATVGAKNEAAGTKGGPAGSIPGKKAPAEERAGERGVQRPAQDIKRISEAIEVMVRQVEEFSRQNAELIAEQGFLPSVSAEADLESVSGFGSFEPEGMFFPVEMAVSQGGRRNAGIQGFTSIKGIKGFLSEPEHIARLPEKAGEAHRGILNGISKVLKKTAAMAGITDDGGEARDDSGESFFWKSGILHAKGNLFAGAVTALIKSGLIGRAAAAREPIKGGTHAAQAPSKSPDAGRMKEGAYAAGTLPGMEMPEAESFGIFIPPLIRHYRPGALQPGAKTAISSIFPFPEKGKEGEASRNVPPFAAQAGEEAAEGTGEFLSRVSLKYSSAKSGEAPGGAGEAEGAAQGWVKPLDLSHKKEKTYSGPGERRENINAAAPEFMEDRLSYPDIEFISGDSGKINSPVFSLIKDGKKDIKQEPAKRLMDMVTEDDINELTEELAENITEMLSKDLGSIAELVYGIIEDKLRLEKQIRGIF